MATLGGPGKRPTVPNLPQWKLEVGKRLVTYGGYADQAEMKWVGEVWANGQTLQGTGGLWPQKIPFYSSQAFNYVGGYGLRHSVSAHAL